MSRLKIKQEHQSLIEPLISCFLTGNQEKIREHIKFLRVENIQGRVKDMDMRLRWDILQVALSPRDREIFFEEVYQYANDDNVDALLKKLIDTKTLLK